MNELDPKLVAHAESHGISVVSILQLVETYGPDVLKILQEILNLLGTNKTA